MFSVLSDLCCEFAPYGCQTRVKIYCWMLRDHCNFAIWWELPRIPLGPACRCILWSHEHANDSLALGVVPTQYHFFRQNVMNAPDIKRGSEHFNFRADKLLLHERCIGTPIATSPNQNPAKNWKFSTTKAAAAQLKDACLSFPMLGPVPQPPGKFRSVGKLIRVVNQKWNKSVQIVFAWYVDMSNMILISLFFVCAFLNSFVQHLVLKSIGCQFQCTVILVQVRHRFSTLGHCAWKIAKGGTWKAGGFVFGHSNNEGIAWYYYVVSICIWLYLKC